MDGLPPDLPPDPLGADVDRELELAIADVSRRLADQIPAPPPTVLPEDLARHARDNGGVFTAATARQYGLGEADIRRMLRRSAIVGLRRGVYAEHAVVEASTGSAADRHRLDVAAVLAASAPTTVASHESAATIWGIALLNRSSADELRLTRPSMSARGRRDRDRTRISSAELPASHVRRKGGVRVTSPARTVVDLARSLPFRDAVVVADSAMHRGLVSRTALERMLIDCSTWPGIAKAARAVAFADKRSESPLESISRVTFHEFGLPAPQPQAWINTEPVMFRVDFLWREYRTVGEADGKVKYTDSNVVWEEKLRQEDIADLGFELVRWTWEIDKHPERVVQRVERALRRATSRFGLPDGLAISWRG